MTQLDTEVRGTDFDRTTLPAPVPGRPGEFAVQLDPGWSSLVGVHGGYLCAIAVRGAGALDPDRMVRTLTTSFLRTAQVGPATLSVREVRRGRSITTMVTDLTQDGRLLTTSRLTLLTDAMATDWFPPPAFVRLAPPTGGVSIDLTTHVHQPHLVLGDRWLTGAFSIRTSGGGLAVEHGVLAEQDGTLVAESFQTRLTAKD